jgi:signal transduction histidine kinase
MSGGCASLARVIRDKRAWIVSAALPARAEHGEAAPAAAALLDQIAEFLEGEGGGDALAPLRELGQTQAAARASAGGGLAEMLGEYAALRAATVNCYEAELGRDARIDGLRRLDAAIDAAALGAAAHHEASLQQARRTAQQREDVLAVVSHDLGNPLGAVLMASSSLLSARPEPETDEAARKGLQSIHRAASRMRRLIQDLVDFTNIDAGQFSLRMAPQAPASLAAEAVEPFTIDASRRNVALHVEVAPDVPAVDCDRDRILQVLWNLVANAMTSSRSGGIVTVRAERRAQDVLFSVTDTGSGIPPDELPEVFERGRRRARYKSAGVGLSIAPAVLAAHHGRIWAESEPGRGAAFFFSLPLAA